MKWKGYGKLKQRAIDFFLYSGNKEEGGRREEEGYVNRLIVARFKTRYWNTIIINVYASFSDKKSKVKE